MGEFLLIVNPRAAAGKAGREQPRFESALRRYGAKFETRRTRRRGHAAELAREALLRGAEGVAVIGGDGTMSEALRGFFDPAGRAISPGAWLGPIPCGTGGDFRRTALPAVKDRALARRLVDATPRAFDVGWLEYVSHDGAPAARPFLNIASFGLAGLVDELVNGGSKRMGGRAAFMLGALRASLRYKGQRVRVQIDGQKVLEKVVSNVAVANGQFFGGGMHVAPGARLDDGLFDVVALPGGGVLDQMRIAPALYTGGILHRPGVFHQRGAEIHAEGLGCDPVLLDVDGEAPGRLPATFSIRSNVVRLR